MPFDVSTDPKYVVTKSDETQGEPPSLKTFGTTARSRTTCSYPSKPESFHYVAHVDVLDRRAHEAYVHYHNTDRRLDEWVPESSVRPLSPESAAASSPDLKEFGTDEARGRKRKREDTEEHKRPTFSPVAQAFNPPASRAESESVALDEEERDIIARKRITAKRNFHKVIFGQWQMKTWYFSPYPLGVDDHTATASIRMITGLPASSGKSRPSDTTGSSPQDSSSAHASNAADSNETNEEVTLWVCDKCFKYMKDGPSWELHVRNCDMLHPPGRKVYQRGAHTIWEVDGAAQKLYCQNLSLFGKFFIDVKTLFFDCENFMFYVLTDAESRRDHVLGFFSKEKISYDDYNLACIVILPPYQKKRYGMLLIEFSYELSRRSQKCGTPERPLSDLGLRSYLTYWISVLVRFFRKILTVAPPEVAPELSRDGSQDLGRVSAKKKKRTKGWDGEVPEVLSEVPQGSYISLVEEPTFGSLRTTHTTISPIDGSATTHLSIKCTLHDIAKATNLRPDDAAFALRECGFLTRVRAEKGHGEEQDKEVLVISREMVEAVATERKVKQMCLDVAHVLL